MYKSLLTTVSAAAMLFAGATYAADKGPYTERTNPTATQDQTGPEGEGSSTRADSTDKGPYTERTNPSATQDRAGPQGASTLPDSADKGPYTERTNPTATQTQAGAGPRAEANATLTSNGTYQSYEKNRAAFTGRVAANLSADDLIGTDIVDRAGKDVGEISDLLVDSQGNVNHVLVDVGGFLGIGARTVALDIRQLTPEQGSGDAMVTTMTEAQLKALPEVQSEGNMWRSSTSTSTGTTMNSGSPSANSAPGAASGTGTGTGQ